MIVALAGWRGSGATTASLLLASALSALSEREVDAAWLVEADPAGGVLAGRIRLSPAALGGLEQLSFPPGGVAVEPDAVAARAGAMSMLLGPTDPFRADACHRSRLPLIERLSRLDAPVVIDLGRLRAGSPARPLLERADAVLVVTSPEVSAAVSTVEWLQAQGRVSALEASLDSAELSMLVVEAPSGVSFPQSTVMAELGDRLAGWFPWEPTTVDELHRGVPIADRRLRRSALARAATRLAGRLLDRHGDVAVRSPSTRGAP